MAEDQAQNHGAAVHPGTPLVAAFRHVVEKLAIKGMTAALYEETLTAFFLGGLASSFPLFADRYGHPQGRRECSWKQFNKARSSNRESEAASGADLALVLWHSPDLVRVAVFQAKRAKYNEVKKSFEIDINQVPADPGERRTQFAMLISTGLQFAEYISDGKYSPTTELVLELEGLWPEPRGRLAITDSLPWHVNDASWIHYLAYTAQGPRCLAVNNVGLEAIEWEFDRNKGENLVDLERSVDFISLLRSGITNGAGWLTMKSDHLKTLLPSLIHIAPTLVVDESGGGAQLRADGVEAVGQSFEAKASSPEQIAALNSVLEDSEHHNLESSSDHDGSGFKI